MQYSTKRSTKLQRHLALSALTAAVLAGCGGSGGAPDQPGSTEVDASLLKSVNSKSPNGQRSPAPAPASGPAAAPAPTPVPSGPELLQNPSFSGMQPWAAQDGNTYLVASELRSGGQALRVGSKAWQDLPVGKLVPGASYSLVLKARTLQAGSSEAAVVFEKPDGETFRTYKATVSSTSYSDVRVDFTVPVYSGGEYVTLKASGAPFIVDSASLKQRDPIPVTEPLGDTTYSYVPTGYTLAFNDEFNGTDLNRNKWFTRYIYAGETQDRLNDEQQRFSDNGNHVVSNGVLNLVAKKVSSNDPWGINYESGMIRSDWTAHYGYYEARVKMPGGRGVWPAFWLNSDVSATGVLTWPPEIDIFEYVVTESTELRNMLHTGNITTGSFNSVVSYADPNFNQQWTYWSAPYNFNEGWHTVGMEWTPTSTTTYIDGKKIVTRSMNWTTTDGPAHILLNLAVGGSWAGSNGIDDSAFPQALQIDWVRAYRKTN